MRLTAACVVLVLIASGGLAGARSSLKKPKRGFQTRVPAFTIQPQEDWEGCLYGELSNKKPIDISGFELAMPAGAHHFVLWKYDGQKDEAPRSWTLSPGCTGQTGGGSFVPNNLFGMQTPNGRVRFPEGVAVRIGKHQPVLFNPHMKNFTTAPETPDVRFNIIPAKPGSVKHLAESLTVGNGDMHIPAGKNQRLEFDWIVPGDMYIVQLSTHQHSLGTATKVDLYDAEGGAMMENVITNDSWEHPVEWWPEVPRLVTKGQVLHTTCEWHNDRDHDVTFGVETTDEMCFLTGYFYKADLTQPLPACTHCSCVRPEDGLLCFAPATTEIF